MACCGSRLHYLWLAKPTPTIWTNYWQSARLSVTALREGDSRRKTGWRWRKRGTDTISWVAVIPLPLGYTHPSVHTYTSLRHGVWTEAANFLAEEEKEARGCEMVRKCLIAFGSGSCVNSRENGIKSISGYPLTALSFEWLSSVIFNNPWVNTVCNCSINNWKEMYKLSCLLIYSNALLACPRSDAHPSGHCGVVRSHLMGALWLFRKKHLPHGEGKKKEKINK